MPGKRWGIRFGERSWCMNDYTEEVKAFPTKAAAESYATLSHHRNYEVHPL